MTVFWSSVLKKMKKQAAVLSFLTLPKKKPQEGEVLAVGPGSRDDRGKLVPLDVKAGDRILFGKWSGTEVKLSGEDRIIMKESDILGVLDK